MGRLRVGATCAIIILLAFLMLLSYCSIPIKSLREEFKFVTVNLLIKDNIGNPVGEARVLAFSEDWGIKSPGSLDQQTFWLTDSMGRLSISIPIGKWSFFVVSGPNYAYSHPGKGIFIVDLNRIITDDTFIELKPSEKITIAPKDVYGKSIEVEARIMEASHAPIIPTDVVALSSGGRLVLEVSTSYNYDVLLVKRPTYTSDGYYIRLSNIQPGFNGEIYFKSSELAQVIFFAYDKENNLTEGNVEVRIPQFDLNNMVIDFTFQNKTIVYFTPGVYQFNYRFITSGWYLYLGGNNFFNLTKDESKMISFGGPFHEELQVIPWASRGIGGSPNFAPRTQVWLKITDSFEHVLLFMETPSGRPRFPFNLTRDGTVVFQSFIPQRDPFTLLINNEFEEDSSPNFTVAGDLGPFGKFQLYGTLISEKTMYKVQNITTRHFLAVVPVGFPSITARMLEFMDKLYEVYSDMVGGVPIEGQVQYEVDIMGCGFWWESLPVPAKVLLVVYIISDPLSPNTLFFTAHEFGHTRTLRNPTFIAPDFFGESIPTLLAIEGLSRIYGRRIWFWGTGSHDLFFYHIKGVPLSSRSDLIETSQFVLAYIQRKYGWDAHKRVLSGWSGEFSSLVSKLRKAGFNDIEILATIYSYVVGDNLGWLFDLAGLGVTEERVNQGMNIVSQLGLSPLTVGVSSICAIGVPGPLWALSENVVPIVSGDEDTTPVPSIVAMATEFENGRVVALGHDGFLINEALGLFDNKRFGNNIVDWLDKSGTKKILVMVGHREWYGGTNFDSFKQELESRGYTVTRFSGQISVSSLSGAGVVLIGNAWGDFSQQEIDALKSFVSTGGGLLLMGLGWSWEPYNPGKTLDDYP